MQKIDYKRGTIVFTGGTGRSHRDPTAGDGGTQERVLDGTPRPGYYKFVDRIPDPTAVNKFYNHPDCVKAPISISLK